jgi:hypothetical protein
MFRFLAKEILEQWSFLRLMSLLTSSLSSLFAAESVWSIIIADKSYRQKKKRRGNGGEKKKKKCFSFITPVEYCSINV